jgi:hypothetical protein
MVAPSTTTTVRGATGILPYFHIFLWSSGDLILTKLIFYCFTITYGRWKKFNRATTVALLRYLNGASTPALMYFNNPNIILFL